MIDFKGHIVGEEDCVQIVEIVIIVDEGHLHGKGVVSHDPSLGASQEGL